MQTNPGAAVQCQLSAQPPQTRVAVEEFGDTDLSFTKQLGRGIIMG